MNTDINILKKTQFQFKNSRNDSNIDHQIKSLTIMNEFPNKGKTLFEKDSFKFKTSVNNTLNTLKTTSPKNNINVPSFFCPYCEHCNQIDDPYLDSHIQSTRESKSILTNRFEYVIKSNLLKSKKINLFNENSVIFDNFKEKDEIEQIFNSIPNLVITNRLTYRTLAHFLNSLIDDKLNLESFSPELYKKLNDCAFTKGKSFDNNELNLNIDKELKDLFDENYKKMLQYQLKSILLFLIKKSI